jgi:hypothetical protein
MQQPTRCAQVTLLRICTFSYITTHYIYILSNHLFILISAKSQMYGHREELERKSSGHQSLNR